MSKNLLDKSDLDDVLQMFCIYSRYHAVAVFWMCLGFMYNTIIFNNYVLIVEEVRYGCADSNSTYKNMIISSNFSNAQNLTAWCRDPQTCAQWRYEDPDSFVAEFQLACQDWKRTLVGTVHTFGYMIGVMIVGPLSDRFGRRTLAVAAGVTGAVCGLVKSFVTIYWIYIALEFLEAAIGDPWAPLYLLALEMVSAKSRVTYCTILNVGVIIGGTSFPLIRWLVPYWRTCLRVLYAPGLLFIFLIYLLDESPTWLLTKGDVKATVKNIEKAAKLNKMEIKENLNLLKCEEVTTSNFMTVIADTLKSKTLLKRFFVCIIWWNTCTFVDHGLTVNSVFLKGNKYVNYALSSVTKIPAAIIGAYLMIKYNRRGPLIFCFVFCAALCVGQPYVPKNLHWLATTMYMASKVTSGMFFKITYMFTSELFPTYTRHSMLALCACLGRFGGIIATQMPLLMIYWSDLPILIFGAMSLMAALVTFLVPDTAKAALPNTVRQAEALGMFFNITYTYTSELFPTNTRNSMHALCSSMGRIGSILAPQMPLLVVYCSKLPIVLFGATAFVAALVTLLVPDTAKSSLPETVRQAKALGTSIPLDER